MLIKSDRNSYTLLSLNFTLYFDILMVAKILIPWVQIYYSSCYQSSLSNPALHFNISSTKHHSLFLGLVVLRCASAIGSLLISWDASQLRTSTHMHNLCNIVDNLPYAFVAILSNVLDLRSYPLAMYLYFAIMLNFFHST